jgi:hypothetical protein
MRIARFHARTRIAGEREMPSTPPSHRARVGCRVAQGWSLAFCASIILISTSGAGAAVAHAQGMRVSVTVRTREAARPITVIVRSTRSSTCSLVVHARRVTQRMPTLRVDRTGVGGWRWIALPSSPSGRWYFNVSCKVRGRSTSQTARTIVRTLSQISTGPVGDAGTLVVRGTIVGAGHASAPAGLGGYGNPFP